MVDILMKQSSYFSPSYAPYINKIAITGRIGSGKTELANVISRNWWNSVGIKAASNYNSDSMIDISSFADSLRSKAASFLGVHPSVFTGSEKEKYRWILIELGNNIARKYDENFWVNIFNDKWRHERELHHHTKKLYIIDDVRRQNELHWALNNGFFVIRLSMPEDRAREYLQIRKHLSEEQIEERFNETSEVELSYLDDLELPMSSNFIRVEVGQDVETTYEKIKNLVGGNLFEPKLDYLSKEA